MSYELRPLEKCICCGAEISVRSDATSVQCSYCRTRMSISRFTREEKRLVESIKELETRTNAQSNAIQSQITALHSQWQASLNGQLSELFRQGEEYQRGGRFDKAIDRYEALLVKSPTPEAEIHWRIMLCHYGIEYIREQSSGIALPTLTKMSISDLLHDESYLNAVRHAPDQTIRTFYEDEAHRIHAILMKYQQINGTQPPYDVFISVKQGDSHGQATSDGYEALELHHELEKMGWKVFNSRTCLKQYSGTEYEPYIMHALSTAKVLIMLASSEEYMNSPWVRNEWRRFRWLQVNSQQLSPENRHERRLIAYILGTQTWSMPELGGLQIIRAASDPTPMATLTQTVRALCGDRSMPQPVFPNMPGMTSEQMAQFMQMFAMYQQMQGIQINAQPSTPVQTAAPVQTPPPKVKSIVIGDNALEQALREKLHKHAAETITEEDLAGITTLNIQSKGIQNIGALQYCTALTALYLTNNQISDISPLAHCTKLTNLSLAINQISDISPLAACAALTELSLTENPTRSIAPLSSCTKLVTLYLIRNQLTDISALAHCTALKKLYLSDNQIANIQPLSACTDLRSLEMSNNQITDISALASCTHLNGLIAGHNQIKDVSPLAHCSNISIIGLEYNRVTDITSLSACTKLNRLHLTGNPSPMRGEKLITALKQKKAVIQDEGIRYAADNTVNITSKALKQALYKTLNKKSSEELTLPELASIQSLNLRNMKLSDISVLRHCTALDTLNLSNNQIADISPLASCTALQWLDLTNNQIADISSLASCTKLETLWLSSNRISNISALASCVRLEALNLAFNQITDISSIASCKHLTELQFNGNPITNLEPLDSLYSLKELILSPIPRLPLLSGVIIDENPFSFTPLGLAARLTARHLDPTQKVLANLKKRGCEIIFE